MMHFRKVDQSQVLASGITADIFPWGNDRVLKLLHQHFPSSKAEREFEISRAVHAVGVSVPMAIDVIQVGGRYGIVFERVEGPTLFRLGQNRPWLMFQFARQLAELHAQIHTRIAPSSLPSQHADIDRRIKQNSMLSESDKQIAHRILPELPLGEALCHGDFHPGNILISHHGPVVIDWETASRGDPFGDVARTLVLLQSAHPPASTPAQIRFLINMTRSPICNSYLRRYLELRPAVNDVISRWMLAQRAASGAEGI
jgi:uncharacterized protein (TIGR02172 family)